MSMQDLRRFIRQTLTEAKLQPGQARMNRDDALLLAWDVIELLGLTPVDPDDVSLDTTWTPQQGIPIGSIRRHKPDVSDIDIVATSPVEKSMIAALPGVSELRGGKARIDFVFTPMDQYGQFQPQHARSINIMFALDPDAFGTALITWTGPASYNMRIRAVAKRRGWKLSQNGLIDPDGQMVPTPSERAVLQVLGFTEREPQER